MRNRKLNLGRSQAAEVVKELADAGVDILSGRQARNNRRKNVAMAVLAVGALSAIPLAIKVARRHQAEKLDSSPKGELI